MSAVLKYDAACLAISEARSFDEVREWQNKAEAVREYARRAKNKQLEVDCAEIRLRAERRRGELLGEMRAGGLLIEGRPKENGNSESTIVRVRLDDLDTTKNESSRAQKLAAVSPEKFEGMLGEWRERVSAENERVTTNLLKEGERAEAEAARAARSFKGGTVDDLHELAASGFRAGGIMADVAWHYVTRSPRGEGRGASVHYNTQRDIEAVKALPVAQLAAPDSILGFWVMDWDPDLSMARAIIDAWGFIHKTTLFTWAKLNPSGEGWHMGQGYWTRANPETCLLATRGSPKRLHADVRQLIVSPLMEHSRKPDEAYLRMERLTYGPYLELNARRERPGWVTWGDELEFKVPEALPEHDPETGEVLDVPQFLPRGSRSRVDAGDREPTPSPFPSDEDERKALSFVKARIKVRPDEAAYLRGLKLISDHAFPTLTRKGESRLAELEVAGQGRAA